LRDTDKQNAYTTALNEAEAMINKQTGQNANQTEVELASASFSAVV
jgi:hypothetical protein